MEGKVRIGRVSRLHGYKGEVSLKLEAGFIDLFAELDHVFLAINDKPVPFFVNAVRYTPQGYALVFFDGVEDQAEAERIRGFDIWIEESLIPIKELDENDPENLIGYQAIDVNLGQIGAIGSIVEHPGNTFLVIDREDGQVLIPMHKDILKEIDHKGKVVHVDVPEGLIELNLN
jgi:16S rRNA processing protein RimM